MNPTTNNFAKKNNNLNIYVMSKEITISGKVLFKDKKPIKGAKIKIWETDSLQKKNSDDLIVNDTTDNNGKFSGKGEWKDSGLTDVLGTYRYEVTYDGKLKKGSNITNPHDFFDEVKTSWLSPAQEKDEEEKDSVTISGKVVYKDGKAISGAVVQIWETDSLQKSNADDLIVNDTSDINGHFSGSGKWKDSGPIDKATYRYKVSFKGKVKEGTNILNPHSFFEELNTNWLSPAQEKEEAEKDSITINGKVVYKDGTAIRGAVVKIWETDALQKNNQDDLIVNDTSDANGRFSGSGRWKDSGIVDKATYRYKVTYKEKVKEGTNILNPHDFFETLNTKWLSPAQEKEEEQKKNITIVGRVVYKDGKSVKGARVRIWETDNFKKNNADDLIVDKISGSDGEFSGTGKGKDTGGIQTFRYKVTMPGTNLVVESDIKELPKSSLNVINTKWESKRTWKNWLDSHETEISNARYHFPASGDEIKEILVDAVKKDLKVKVVGSGHSHSKVAQPVANNMLIDLSKLSGELNAYSWLKPKSEIQLVKNTNDLVRVKAGTLIRTLNRNILVPKNLGLINMGPFDGQTISGVINTNTHGTGISLPGFSDMVKSVEMYVVKAVSKGNHTVECWVIEPKNGISDPARFKKEAKGLHLIQNDEVFHSVVCGYGLFGIVYAYTLEIRNLYWLDENFQHTTWKGIKDKLNDTVKGVPKLLVNNHQVKLYVHTAECLKKGEINNDIHCRIDTWNEQPVQLKPHDWDDTPEIHKIWPPMRPRTAVGNLGRFVSGSTFDVNGVFNNGKPSDVTVQTLTSGFFKASNKDHFLRGYGASVYYRAIRRLRDNNTKYDPSLKNDRMDNTKFEGDPETSDFGISIEFSVPISETIKAIETSINFLTTTKVNFLTPTGIRFTQRSNHYLCPAYDRDCTFIEITGWLPDNRKNDWDKFREKYDKALTDLIRHLQPKINGIRFHKGKFNIYVDKTLREDYPKYDIWVNNYHIFNASGIFDCPNADKWKLNLSDPKYTMKDANQLMEGLK